MSERGHEHLTTGPIICPHCGGESFEAVSDGEATNLLCLACWSCWYVELGYVSLVDPETCPGCEHKDRCLSLRPALPR